MFRRLRTFVLRLRGPSAQGSDVSLSDYPVSFYMPSIEAPMPFPPDHTVPFPPDHTAGRKPDFILPSAEGRLGYPEDLLLGDEPEGAAPTAAPSGGITQEPPRSPLGAIDQEETDG